MNDAEIKQNQPETAQAHLSKTKFPKYAKGTLITILLVSQCLKIFKGMSIRLEDHFFPNWKKISFFQKFLFGKSFMKR